MFIEHKSKSKIESCHSSAFYYDPSFLFYFQPIHDMPLQMKHKAEAHCRGRFIYGGRASKKENDVRVTFGVVSAVEVAEPRPLYWND